MEKGSFQGKGGRKFPSEGRKEVSKGRVDGSFQGKGGWKFPREGRMEVSKGRE